MLVNRSLCVMSLLVLTDVTIRLGMLDVTIKRKRFIGFMCLISSWGVLILLNGVKWAVLEGVQDVVLDPIRPKISLQI